MRTKVPQPKYFYLMLTNQAARKMVAYYNRELSSVGITAQQMLSLGVLWHEDGISLGVFAHRAGLGKAAAATMIKRLEAMGLVQRDANPDDARLNALSLTPKSIRLIPQVTAKVAELEANVERVLGKDQARSLHKSLVTIKDMEL